MLYGHIYGRIVSVILHPLSQYVMDVYLYEASCLIAPILYVT